VASNWSGIRPMLWDAVEVFRSGCSRCFLFARPVFTTLETSAESTQRCAPSIDLSRAQLSVNFLFRLKSLSVGQRPEPGARCAAFRVLVSVVGWRARSIFFLDKFFMTETGP